MFHTGNKPEPNGEATVFRVMNGLTGRYIAVLAAVGVLLTLDQALLQPRLESLSVFAPRINIAGRQRMLSQKLVKSKLAMQAPDQAEERDYWKNELETTLTQWKAAHQGLLSGDSQAGLPPTTNPEILNVFAQLEPHYQAMLQAVSSPHDADPSSLSILLENEAKFLPLMDQIVGLYEQDARKQATTLRLLGLAAAASVILLLVVLGRIVLVPATQTIRRQMQELESRVAERTSELTAANESLVHEIDVRRQAEERTREISEKLAHASRVTSLGQLATGLAHEINQPLAAIANYSEAISLHLEKEPLDGKPIRDAAEKIGASAFRAGEIVRGMRNFLRPGQVDKRSVNVNGLIHDVVLLCQPELMRNSVELQLELAPQGAFIVAAATQIQQVLMNLIQNSIQAMQETPAEDRLLRICNHCDEERVHLEVIDQGTGFGDLDPESIFAPFLTTKSSGLGIGLSIVRSIVQEHGGKVHAENRSRGSLIRVSLPLKVKREQPDIAPADRVCS